MTDGRQEYVTWNCNFRYLTPQEAQRLREARLIYRPEESDSALHYPTSDDVSDDGEARFERIVDWTMGRGRFESIPSFDAT